MLKKSNIFVGRMAQPFLSFRELMELLRSDPTARSLFYSNMFSIVIALWQGWGLRTVMFIYCGQSIIIGFFNVIRILRIKQIKKGDEVVSGMPVSVNYFLAGFFAVHYGFFNFGYFSFIGRPHVADGEWIWVTLAVFFANHLFSFWRHARENVGVQDIVRLMFFPYLRIIPMHITIIFGGFFMMLVHAGIAERLVLVFFLLLKTNVDLKTHMVEHDVDSQTTLGDNDPLGTIHKIV